MAAVRKAADRQTPASSATSYTEKEEQISSKHARKKENKRPKISCLNCNRKGAKNTKCDEMMPRCGNCKTREEECKWPVKVVRMFPILRSNTEPNPPPPREVEDGSTGHGDNHDPILIADAQRIDPRSSETSDRPVLIQNTLPQPMSDGDTNMIDSQETDQRELQAPLNSQNQSLIMNQIQQGDQREGAPVHGAQIQDYDGLQHESSAAPPLDIGTDQQSTQTESQTWPRIQNQCPRVPQSQPAYRGQSVDLRTTPAETHNGSQSRHSVHFQPQPPAGFHSEPLQQRIGRIEDQAQGRPLAHAQFLPATNQTFAVQSGNPRKRPAPDPPGAQYQSQFQLRPPSLHQYEAISRAQLQSLALAHPQAQMSRPTPHQAPQNKSRMLKGQTYDQSDPELVYDRARCRALLSRFNSSSNASVEDRRYLAKGFLGSVGAHVEIEAPLRCEYGYNIKIGDGTYIGPDCIIEDPSVVSIGSKCFIGPRVSICCKRSSPNLNDHDGGRTLFYAPGIWIEDRVCIEAGVTIHAGVRIGRGSTIVAGSNVTKSIRERSLVGGNPATPFQYL